MTHQMGFGIVGWGSIAPFHAKAIAEIPNAKLVAVQTSKAENVATIRGYLATLENLQTCGRNGLHRYNNQDHSMWTAILAALNLLDGETHDVWAVNVEAEYHEEGEVVSELLAAELAPAG